MRGRSTPSPTGWRRAGGCCSAARPPRCCASTTRPRVARGSFEVDRCVLVVLDEADAGDPRRDDGGASTTSAPRRVGEDAALVERWLERRNDVSALGALWERGIVVDTLETAAPWSALDRGAPRRSPRPSARSRAPRSPRCTSPTPTSTARACTSPSPGRPDDADALLRARCGTPPRRRARRRRVAQPPPRRRAQPRAATSARPSAPAPRCWRRSSGALDPDGLLNPSVLEPRAGDAPGDRAALVVDVGTSSVRSSLVDPDGTVHATRQVAVLPSTPAPGTVEVDADAIADGGARDGVGRAREGRPTSRASASPTSARRRSSGTPPPVDRSARASAGRTSAPSSTASCCRARACASHPTRRRPSCAGSCSTRPRELVVHGPTAIRHDRHLGRPRALARRRCTSPTRPTPA